MRANIRASYARMIAAWLSGCDCKKQPSTRVCHPGHFKLGTQQRNNQEVQGLRMAANSKQGQLRRMRMGDLARLCSWSWRTCLLLVNCEQQLATSRTQTPVQP